MVKYDLSFLFVTDDVCGLELRFDEFRVETSAAVDECANDYLEVSDGKGNTMRYCGFVSGIRLVQINNFSRYYKEMVG